MLRRGCFVRQQVSPVITKKDLHFCKSCVEHSGFEPLTPTLPVQYMAYISTILNII